MAKERHVCRAFDAKKCPVLRKILIVLGLSTQMRLYQILEKELYERLYGFVVEETVSVAKKPSSYKPVLAKEIEEPFSFTQEPYVCRVAPHNLLPLSISLLALSHCFLHLPDLTLLRC